MKLQQMANIKAVPDHFPSEVTQENRRLTGVTPRLLKSFPESPARYLPRAKGLRGLKSFAGGRKISKGGL